MRRIFKKLLRPGHLLRFGSLAYRFILKNGSLRTLSFAFRIVRDHGVQGAAEAFLLRLSGTPPVIAEWGRARMAHHYAIHAHDVPVDIIICVHNALEDVHNCLTTLSRQTLPPYRLILIDDGSSAETRDYVAQFAATQGALLIRNETARGYTKAANQGLRAATAELIVLLNSDTIVTPLWLDRMVTCLLSDRHVGMCGPLSNAASWQSIPRIEENGDWAENPYPQGITPERMALMLAASTPRHYPKVGFLNGFCLLLRAEMLNDVGYFDEEAFGAGYGEENDYALRAAKRGWKLAIADDAYVHHTQSRSYSHERRKALCARADQALREKHTEAAILEALGRTKDHPCLAGIRARAAHYSERQALIEDTRRRYEGKRVFFILPVLQAGGGGHVILREAEALSSMGVNVSVINLMINHERFEEQHPYLQVPMHYIHDLAELDELAARADVMIATLFLSVHWIAEHIDLSRRRVKFAYYIQDYEPHFFDPSEKNHQLALSSYTLIPEMHLLTKSRWNREEVKAHTGRVASLLGPSYAWNMFYPSMPKPGALGVVRVVAMIRPNTPRRAPELTLRVLKRLKETLGERIEIITFGVSAKDPALKQMAVDFPHLCAGELPTMQVAGVLDASDVFLDFSTYQAMGLTALEAMACGVAVIAPVKGGSGEFIRHEENGLLVDTSDEEACYQVALRLIQDAPLRMRLQQAALHDAVCYYPEKSARALLDAVFAQPHEQKESPHAPASAA